MRRAATALIAVVAFAAALTGCGASGETKAEKDKHFITELKSMNFESWEYDKPSKEALLALPGPWCAALKEGRSSKPWVYTDSDLYPGGGGVYYTASEEATRLIVLAVETYCPGQTERVKKEMRSTGLY